MGGGGKAVWISGRVGWLVGGFLARAQICMPGNDLWLCHSVQAGVRDNDAARMI